MDNVEKEFLFRVITVKRSQGLAVVGGTRSLNFNWWRKRAKGKEGIMFYEGWEALTTDPTDQ